MYYVVKKRGRTIVDRRSELRGAPPFQATKLSPPTLSKNIILRSKKNQPKSAKKIQNIEKSLKVA
jgi:hypothetical protein